MSNTIELPIPLSQNQFKSIVMSCLEEFHLKNEAPSDYSKSEFSIKIDKSESWIDARRREGVLKWFMRGGTVRIPHSELERLRDNEIQVPQAASL